MHKANNHLTDVQLVHLINTCFGKSQNSELLNNKFYRLIFLLPFAIILLPLKPSSQRHSSLRPPRYLVHPQVHVGERTCRWILGKQENGVHQCRAPWGQKGELRL